jgi:hypothetical protein
VHGLVAQDDSTPLDNAKLESLLSLLTSDDWHTRAGAAGQILAMIAADPTAAAYEQLYQASFGGNAELAVRIQPILQRAFPLGQPEINQGNNTIGLSFPSQLIGQTGDNTKFTVDLETTSGSIAFDNGQNQSIYEIGYNQTTIPDILLTPKVAGQATITITVQKWYRDPTTNLVNPIGDPLVEKLTIDVVDTNP